MCSPSAISRAIHNWSLDITDRLIFNEIWAKFIRNSVEVPGQETETLCAVVDLAGIYSRWDLINIHVRQEPYEPVVCRKPVERSPSESERLNDLEARVKQLEQHLAKLFSDERIDI